MTATLAVVPPFPDPAVSVHELRRSLGQARIAARVAAQRVAVLERRLGIAGQMPPEDLVRAYADMYGDTPEVTARRCAALLEDTLAMSELARRRAVVA
ncbi:hypothetical protein [Cellulosimicrobium sp. I38E]|uniref:hypothetical protein n=1 Tax=Cellulosimicrobium sp. I38E TaxID=1393139 RepID=UPI0007B2B9A6|nr:hypothetical protein [Cellulosimicrobium sp. I38E]KZM78380.1 hypothetical protein A0J59_13690 [Cellulosimicrobium sp. I38E]